MLNEQFPPAPDSDETDPTTAQVHDLPVTVVRDAGLPMLTALIGVAKQNYNLALLYEGNGVTGRLAATRPVTFMVFDVLRVAGTGVTHLPWTDRRRLLEALDLDGLHCQVPQVHDDGAALFEATRESGLEGVVSKRRSAPYLPGRRSGDWVKSAHRLTVSAVVGGWRPESNGSGRIGALLVGQPDGAGGWRYAGRVGSGVSGAAAERLTAALEPLVREVLARAGGLVTATAAARSTRVNAAKYSNDP